MGEIRDDERGPVADWEAIVSSAASGGALGENAAAVRAAGPPPSGPPAELRAPLIIDTDLGGDPDDAVAVAVAALRVPELALVITTDEVGGERARLARHLLDLAGRPEVPVAAGADLGGSRYFCVEGLVPGSVPFQDGDVSAAVRAVTSAADGGPVRWLGIGPMTNLAALMASDPDAAARLVVTQMGGALAYRDPTRAEHNARLDPPAAITVLTGMRALTLVPSDVTFTEAIQVSADSPIARGLAGPAAPGWARLLSRHLDRWFERFHPATMQHDGLALAAALGHPALDYADITVTIAADGRMTATSQGTCLHMATRADYGGFMWWLGRQLDWETRPPADLDEGDEASLTRLSSQCSPSFACACPLGRISLRIDQRQLRSVIPQSSAIRPSVIRMISMMVGRGPPAWSAGVPCTTVRTASLSPSASMSSTDTRRSGYFSRIIAHAFLTAPRKRPVSAIRTPGPAAPVMGGQRGDHRRPRRPPARSRQHHPRACRLRGCQERHPGAARSARRPPRQARPRRAPRRRRTRPHRRGSRVVSFPLPGSSVTSWSRRARAWAGESSRRM